MIAFLEQFESITEMEHEPETWVEVIEAIIAGAVDHEDIEPLCVECGRRADVHLDHSQRKHPSPWSSIANLLAESLTKSHRERGEAEKPTAELLRRMAGGADLYEEKLAATA